MSTSSSYSRQAQIAAALAQVAAGDLRGEPWDEDAIRRDNAALWPELGQELRALRRVLAARRIAQDGSTGLPRLGALTGSGPSSSGPTPRDRTHLIDDSQPARTFPAPPTGAWSVAGYEVVREVARGGQGAVYLARQLSTDRPVALKRLHHVQGGDPAVRARLTREVQVLRDLRHAGVVAVLDCGIQDEQPFIVTEWIDGQPLDAWLRGRRLSPREVASLFLLIADAVRAAHLRGVIHRDLKPSNILVDGGGAPRVLDFGLAKLSPGSLGGSPPGDVPAELTATGQFVGSLPWSSPEQVTRRPEGLDIRCDVYALGVLLYQALAGEFPYSVTGPIFELVENISQRAPMPLRARRPDVDDELETIVGKCLCKDPAGRYESAGALADDLRRYLAGEPIEAKRASRGYMLRKLAWRYRAAVCAAAAFVLMLTGSSIALAILYQRAAQQSALARTQRDAALRSEEKARRAATTAEQVVNFLTDTLAAADPEEAVGRQVTVVQALGRASERLDRGFGDPRVEIEVRSALGTTYHNLGLYEEAMSQKARALELGRQHLPQTDPQLYHLMNNLAYLLNDRGQPGQAEPLYREAIAGLTQLLGPDHADVLGIKGNFSSALRDLGRFEQLGPLMQEIADGCQRLLGPEAPQTLQARNNLGQFYYAIRDYNSAIPILTDTLAGRRRVLGPQHPRTLITLDNLAIALREDARPAEAEPLFREALAGFQAAGGPDHPDALTAELNLATCLHRLDQIEEALIRFRHVHETRERVLGPDHADTLDAIDRLAQVLLDTGDESEAERLLKTATQRVAAPQNRPAWYAYRVTLSYARLLAAHSRTEEAIASAELGYQGLCGFFGEDHPRTRAAADLLRELRAAHSESVKSSSSHASGG